MAGNIIPAIATTNAMTAGLCVLQAFKVLRSQLSKAKFSFLTRSTERVIATESLQPPNPHCATCGVAYAVLEADLKKAKLGDLVDMLRENMGYGEEFSVLSGAQILFDADEDMHLGKTLGELGIKSDTFLTVVDDAEEEARVDLVLSVVEKEGGEVVKLQEEVVLDKKPKKPEPVPEPNGEEKVEAAMHNGTNGATKRKASDADIGAGEEEAVRKKGKVMAEDDVVVIEDEGAIVLD